MDTWGGLAEERRAIADLLEGLTPDQWQVTTLCPAWDVQAMAAHLTVSCTFTAWELTTTLARARGSVDRAALAMAERRAAQSRAELVAVLRDRAEVRRAPPIVGALGPYTDTLIHVQDVLIPLGRRDERPAERWLPSLDFLVSARARIGFRSAPLPDVQLVATDLDWSYGDGPVVEATAEGLGLALSRRTALFDELSGPGADALRAWAGA
jgi:uncharacterized protein (TIGR03083 family)